MNVNKYKYCLSYCNPLLLKIQQDNNIISFNYEYALNNYVYISTHKTNINNIYENCYSYCNRIYPKNGAKP